jgi:hypothetical protein
MEPTLTIRRVPLDSLHLDPANAREHGPENMEAIFGSLKRFGQAEPLVVQKKAGRVIGLLTSPWWVEENREEQLQPRSPPLDSRMGRRQGLLFEVSKQRKEEAP